MGDPMDGAHGDQKRPRIEQEINDLEEELRFVSLEKRTCVTKAQMEQVWVKVFKCPFPKWEKVRENHLMVRGMTVGRKGKKEKICMSFWPRSGKWFFQGKDALRERHLERWGIEFDKIYGFE